MPRNKTSVPAVLALWILLSGCAALEPAPYHDDRESMQGPGLFSGEDGAFTIYRVPAEDGRGDEPASPPAR